MNDGSAAVGGLLVFIMGGVIAFAVFLVMREVWCWYWKINEALSELRAIRALLERQNPPKSPGPTKF